MTMKAKKTVRKTAAKKASSARPAAKRIYRFGKETDGDGSMLALLGGKGANLAEMARIGLPVPPGFTLTTEVCNLYYNKGRKLPRRLEREMRTAVKELEAQTGKRFGDPANPLLLSVRSGARSSMPGMMDTVLNLGLNDDTVEGLARKTGDSRFAHDCYRRFIHMYGDVVMGVRPQDEHSHDPFEEVMDDVKRSAGVKLDLELSAKDLMQLIDRYKKLIKSSTGSGFPQEAFQQLSGAIGAVFDSWHNERAVVYRRKYNIPRDWGTAVNVQTMVFGNMGEDSATVVAFTRDPATGEKVLYGEYLVNAQGEDVVAGTRTPKAIADLEVEMPRAHEELQRVSRRLERHFRDLQDFEFTIEEKALYILQTRNGKRTGLAAVRIAAEMVNERLIRWKTALTRIPADSISTLLVPVFRSETRKAAKLIATGLPAGPGAASGQLVFSAREAERLGQRGEEVILCRNETSPDDIHGMLAANGILTARGGVSSHAALVARQMGKVCVTGASDIHIDSQKRTLTVDSVRLKELDVISIDGTTGEVFVGYLDTAPSEVIQVIDGELTPEQSPTYKLFEQIMKWADRARKLGIRTNADTPEQARHAIALGAEGIGLCRTEHMFFQGERLPIVQEMILAPTREQRQQALDKLLEFQRSDFTLLFLEMEDRPVTIRLLDPPLHEFLPSHDGVDGTLAKSLGISRQVFIERLRELHEQNPMMGHRGCRLGVTFPEITEMQVRALFEAAAFVVRKHSVKIKPEIMVPLVSYQGELEHQTEIIHRVAEEIMTRDKVKIPYLVGTMIEVPRAAVIAGKLARTAAFFSFGTNDLTQTTLGMSRDDSGPFLVPYEKLDIITRNPFASLDTEGVGFLVKLAAENGRNIRKNLKLGICGEHGGDPDSIRFCHDIGLSYVSCAPNRIPVARLAAAQAALQASRPSLAISRKAGSTQTASY